MKSILAFLATFGIVAVATAGSVTWSVDGVSKDGSYVDGGIAYLFVGSNTSGVADAIQANEFDFGAAIASSTTDDEGYLKVSKIGSYVSQEVSFYTIVFDTPTVTDSSNFIISPITTLTFGASGNKSINLEGSDFASASWTPVKESEIVPEPTTVALLALGLAAFGLKRKIA